MNIIIIIIIINTINIIIIIIIQHDWNCQKCQSTDTCSSFMLLVLKDGQKS